MLVQMHRPAEQEDLDDVIMTRGTDRPRLVSLCHGQAWAQHAGDRILVGRTFQATQILSQCMAVSLRRRRAARPRDAQTWPRVSPVIAGATWRHALWHLAVAAACLRGAVLWGLPVHCCPRKTPGERC